MNVDKPRHISLGIVGGLMLLLVASIAPSVADEAIDVSTDTTVPAIASDAVPAEAETLPVPAEVVAPEATAAPVEAPTDMPTDVAVPAPVQAPAGQGFDSNVTPHIRKTVNPNRVVMKASVANLKVGNAFLDDNMHKPGVVKLKSGLQYKVIKAGAGAKPKENDVVLCNYRGTLVDGAVFEQSEAGKPASVKVAPLIAGLKEAIKLMPVGSKWEIYMPSELGFGGVGNMPKVGPDAVLIYELEVLKINALGK